MTDMIEHVARALCRYTWERHIKHKNLPAYIDDHWRDHCAGARVAIDAIDAWRSDTALSESSGVRNSNSET